jgi:hypothetical protein
LFEVVKVAIRSSPTAIRPVTWTSAAVYGDGGTKKSGPLIAVPVGVVTERRPDPVPPGTVVPTLVVVASVAHDRARPLKMTLSFAGLGSKLVPAIVTAVPGVPIVGVKLVIVGASDATVNTATLVADPVGEVTPIGPVVACAGTVVTISVGVAETTVAATPLKLTEFSEAVALKPVPDMVTVVPFGPRSGVKSMIETDCER